MPRKGPNNNDEGNIGRHHANSADVAATSSAFFVLYMIFKNGAGQPAQVSFNEYQRLLNEGSITKAESYKSQLNDFEFRASSRTSDPVDDR